MAKRGVRLFSTLNSRLVDDWVLNFTKPFLAFRRKIFGTERLLTGQSERRDMLLNQLSKGHKTSGMIIPRRRFSISHGGSTAVMALAHLGLAGH